MIVGGVFGGVAVALLLGATLYCVRRRSRSRGTDVQGSSAYGHRPTMPRLFPGSQPSTDNMDISESSTSPTAFLPSSGPVTLAAKLSGPPQSAEPLLSPSSSGHMHTPSDTWTARDAAPNSTPSASHDGSTGQFTSEVIGLRAEIQNLRRAMQEIRTATDQGADAPPQYIG